MAKTNIQYLEGCYQPWELEKLNKKYKRKQGNAKKRGIMFTLTCEEYLLFGKKLLGDGICDYTFIPFDMHTDENGLGNPFYPSLERIDCEGAYALHNCCVVGTRCNELKDSMVDRSNAVLVKDRHDRKIVKNMILHMSDERMEALKEEYSFENFMRQYGSEEDKAELGLFGVEELMQQIEAKEEEPMTPAQELREFIDKRTEKHAREKHVRDIVSEPVVEETAEVEEVQAEVVEAHTDAPEEPKPLPQALPPDVAIAQAYAFYCQIFYDIGMKVDLTFGQFKQVYQKKCCALTGERLGDGLKSILVADRDKGFVKGNFMVVTPVMEKAMTDLMKTTNMTMAELANIFKKV